jgi:hypothetical protein
VTLGIGLSATTVRLTALAVALDEASGTEIVQSGKIKFQSITLGFELRQ